MFGLFNYAPKDFIGKSPEYILDKMKPTKIDDDFFAKYDKPENADFKLLTPSIKAAIQLLIDLKKKMVIYEKCYNKNGSTPTMNAPTMNAPHMQAPARMPSIRHSIKPGHPAQMQMQAAQPGKEEMDAPINMEGGRRRRSRKSKKMRKGKSKSKGTRSKGRKTRGGKKKW